MRLTSLTLYGLAFILAAAGAASAQDRSRLHMDDITISPSRQELIMPPGTEKTVTVRLIYTSASGQSAPARVRAYLGDWSISKQGEVLFHKAGSQPNSACPWIIYTPAETTVAPGDTHVIRVTVSVPKDAAPGDHLAVLFVEPRQDNLKLQDNTKQVQVRFRMGAIFYIMVPELTQKPALEDLRAEAGRNGIVITPSLKNDGNSHVRPTHSVQVLDKAGGVVAHLDEVESLPVLRGGELQHPIVIDKVLGEGSYSVRYRVRFREHDPITEGVTDLVVSSGKEAPQKHGPSVPPARGAKAAGNSGG